MAARSGQVERLVLLASACRLSPFGRRSEGVLAEQTRAGHSGRGWAATGPALAATSMGGFILAGLMWAAGPTMTARNPSDLLTIIAAEDVFDAGPDLHRITAPTLVVGGGRDCFYGRELFQETARGIPRGRLALYQRKGLFGTITHAAAIEMIGEFLASSVPHAWLRQNGGG